MRAFLVPTSFGLIGKACAACRIGGSAQRRLDRKPSECNSPECKCSIIGSNSQNSSLQSPHWHCAVLNIFGSNTSSSTAAAFLLFLPLPFFAGETWSGSSERSSSKDMWEAGTPTSPCAEREEMEEERERWGRGVLSEGEEELEAMDAERERVCGCEAMLVVRLLERVVNQSMGSWQSLVSCRRGVGGEGEGQPSTTGSNASTSVSQASLWGGS